MSKTASANAASVMEVKDPVVLFAGRFRPP
jgi:hypothetical protein